MGEFVRVARTADVQSGQAIVAEVNGKTLAVLNVAGAFHAIDNTCIHRGGPLGEEDLEGSVVTCPGTAGNTQYDVTTGVCVVNPAAKVERYEIQVDGIDVKVLI